MRAWLRGVIIGDATITGKIPAEKWIGSSGWVEGTQPPFGIIVCTDDENRLNIGNSHWYDIFIHEDQRFGYVDVIDPVVDRLKTLVPAAAGVRAGGMQITEAEWLGASGDLIDQDKATAMRTVSFRITGRPLGS